MAEKKLDPKLFNEDPKFSEQRGIFDEMVEAAVIRVTKKKKSSDDPQDQSFGEILDNLFKGD